MFFPGADVAAELGRAVIWMGEDELQPSAWPTALIRHQPEVLVTGWGTPPIPEDWLGSPNCPLRYVCHVTGSVRRLVPRSFIARAGLVSNWGDSVSAQVAEHALLLALAALRNLPAWRPFLARPAAERRIDELGTRTLFGRRIGIHGFGGVARALGTLLGPFNVSVHVFSTGVPAAAIRNANLAPSRSLNELFAGSDVLFECESLTPASAGSVTAQLISALPDGAVFVNVGRGALVDESALVCAARAGRIRLALDVTTEDPLTPGSEVCSLHDVILSPHVGGPTRDRYATCGALALENLARYLRGEAVKSVVTLTIFDRAT